MTSLLAARALNAALDAAEAHGLLTALAERPHTTADLAKARGLDATALERVLEVLRTNGLLARRDACYAATPQLAAELRGPLADAEQSRSFWAHASELLATGRTLVDSRGTKDREKRYASVTPLLARMFDRPAAALADRVAPELSSRAAPRVLDVGAGSGVWSLAIAERLPSARAVALDLPEVLARFVERAEALSLRDRIDTIAGDFHDDAVLGGKLFDVVLLANVVHLEPPDRAEALVRRFGRAVAPGGMLVIVDVLSDGTPELDRAVAAYALHLAMRLPGAHPYPESVLSTWTAAPGLAPPERWWLGEPLPGLAALIARRF